MTGEEEYLPLSGIQHFFFCKRQWGLIHICQLWSDNILTAQGRQMHARVHDGRESGMRGDMPVFRALPIQSRQLRLAGEADLVEFIPDADGIPIEGCAGRFLPHPVEYKRGKTKTTDCDRVQLCAQAICLEEMLHCRIPSGSLFYRETRRREHVPMTEALREETISVCREMQAMFDAREIALPSRSKACKACSLYEQCLPDLRRHVDSYWKQAWRDDSEVRDETTP